MAAPWIAALVALFVWWFSTGAILCLVKNADKRGARARMRAALAGLPVLGLGLWGYDVSLGMTGVAGAYAGFLAALAIWGWVELAFLTGQITGPNTRPCPASAAGWERFLRAWGTIAYNEMVLVALLISMAVHAQGAANAVGLWTFALLFGARISAKLNLFLGVRQIHTDFLPGVLSHLPSHFRVARMNWLLPVCMTLLAATIGVFVTGLVTATSAGAATGFALLAAISALALAEHILMILPLPDDRLWRWMLPSPHPAKPDLSPEDAHGL